MLHPIRARAKAQNDATREEARLTQPPLARLLLGAALIVGPVLLLTSLPASATDVTVSATKDCAGTVTVVVHNHTGTTMTSYMVDIASPQIFQGPFGPLADGADSAKVVFPNARLLTTAGVDQVVLANGAHAIPHPATIQPPPDSCNLPPTTPPPSFLPPPGGPTTAAPSPPTTVSEAPTSPPETTTAPPPTVNTNDTPTAVQRPTPKTPAVTQLPHTGSTPLPLILAGFALGLAGIVLVTVTRRRAS